MSSNLIIAIATVVLAICSCISLFQQVFELACFLSLWDIGYHKYLG